MAPAQSPGSTIGRIALALAALLLAGAAAAGRESLEVANFAVAGHAYGSQQFEKLSFRSGPTGKSIDYAYGPAARTLRLQRQGPSEDGRGLAVRFPNGLVLDIVPDGERLQVSDRLGTYHRSFTWLYEGPVDGRGTACTACVPEAEAVRFVREHFATAAEAPAPREEDRHLPRESALPPAGHRPAR